MKTIIKLPVKILLLPLILTISVLTLLAKVVLNASAYAISPVIFLCAIFSVYCAIEFGLLGFLIAISVSVAGFFLMLAALLTIEVAERINGYLIGFLRA